MNVWSALKTKNYAKYFKLLKEEATLLQACLMHRYIAEVRYVYINNIQIVLYLFIHIQIRFIRFS